MSLLLMDIDTEDDACFALLSGIPVELRSENAQDMLCRA